MNVVIFGTDKTWPTFKSQHIKMSCVMKNLLFAYMRKQRRRSATDNHPADQHLCFPYIGSKIPLRLEISGP